MAPGEGRPNVVTDRWEPTPGAGKGVGPPSAPAPEDRAADDGDARSAPEQQAQGDSTEDPSKRSGRYGRLKLSIGRHPADLVRIAVAAGGGPACGFAARPRGGNEGRGG